MNKYTLTELNGMLDQFNAVISVENACLQSKAAGYIGDQFIDNKKPVYNFDIVSKTDKQSWANIYSDIYRKIPKQVLKEINDAYFETNARIYC
jgi:hypothetical protein